MRNPCRKDLTTTTKQLAKVEIVVDKFHMTGHVDPWCLEHCDARKISSLSEVRNSRHNIAKQSYIL